MDTLQTFWKEPDAMNEPETMNEPDPMKESDPMNEPDPIVIPNKYPSPRGHPHCVINPLIRQFGDYRDSHRCSAFHLIRGNETTSKILSKFIDSSYLPLLETLLCEYSFCSLLPPLCLQKPP